MGNLTAFLAQNAEQAENVKLVVSDRFTDEDGRPLGVGGALHFLARGRNAAP